MRNTIQALIIGPTSEQDTCWLYRTISPITCPQNYVVKETLTNRLAVCKRTIKIFISFLRPIQN